MLRKLPLYILLFLLVSSVFLQVGRASAQELPITSPLTPPITIPVGNITLMGQVVFRQLGRLLGNTARIIPAPNIIVNVVNFFNSNQKYTATTDANGRYSLSLPNGLYEVTLGNTQQVFFVPPLRIVNLKNNQKTANFEGLLFPHF